MNYKEIKPYIGKLVVVTTHENDGEITGRWLGVLAVNKNKTQVAFAIGDYVLPRITEGYIDNYEYIENITSIEEITVEGFFKSIQTYNYEHSTLVLENDKILNPTWKYRCIYSIKAFENWEKKEFNKEDWIITLEEKNNSAWNMICPHCGAPAYMGFIYKIECSNQNCKINKTNKI